MGPWSQKHLETLVYGELLQLQQYFSLFFGLFAFV